MSNIVSFLDDMEKLLASYIEGNDDKQYELATVYLKQIQIYTKDNKATLFKYMNAYEYITTHMQLASIYEALKETTILFLDTLGKTQAEDLKIYYQNAGDTVTVEAKQLILNEVEHMLEKSDLKSDYFSVDEWDDWYVDIIYYKLYKWYATKNITFKQVIELHEYVLPRIETRIKTGDIFNNRKTLNYITYLIKYKSYANYTAEEHAFVRKQLYRILAIIDEQKGVVHEFYYVISLEHIAESYLIEKQYVQARVFYKRYSEYEDFSSVSSFIYRFIRWYGAETHVEEGQDISSLEVYAERAIKIFKDEMGEESYIKEIAAVKESLLKKKLTDADRLLERDIFMRVFEDKQDMIISDKTVEQTPVVQVTQKKEAVFTDLLYMAKFTALVHNFDEITVEIFIDGFSWFDFNGEAERILSEWIDEDSQSKVGGGYSNVELAKKEPRKRFDDELNTLVKKLEKQFGDVSIGTFHES